MTEDIKRLSFAVVLLAVASLLLSLTFMVSPSSDTWNCWGTDAGKFDCTATAPDRSVEKFTGCTMEEP